MPETIATPDFEQITNRIGDRYQAAGEIRGIVDDALRGAIIDALQQVWNARGAADLAVFDGLSSLSRDHRQIVRDEFERDLRGLDR